MKVIHVGTIDEGGAYQAMVRISDSMKMQGIDSSIILRTKNYDDSQGKKCIHGYKIFISKMKNVFNNVCGAENIHVDLFGTNISQNQYIQDADVVFLHWTNSFIPYNSLLKLANLKMRVVWVMHDMWLLTGGCHVDKYCGQYREGCSDCLYVRRKWRKRLISKCYEWKAKVLKELNPILVMPSNWLAECANDSGITKQLKKYVIPNPVNGNVFFKNDSKQIFLRQYDLKSGSKIILFGAIHATTNPHKGFRYLKEALKDAQREDWVLVVFGNDAHAETEKRIGVIPIVYLGLINNEQMLNKIYNSADVFVAPSDQENYANSVLEAMSCGVPAVAFDIGGMPDLIVHKKSGYLVKYGNIQDLLEGIDYCVTNKDQLSETALMDRKRYNSMDVVGKKYDQLCMELLEA